MTAEIEEEQTKTKERTNRKGTSDVTKVEKTKI
jgi:hypothetical protein